MINRIHALALMSFLALTALLPHPPVSAGEKPGELIAGVHRDFPPQYSLDAKTGKPMGFAIDVMDEIAKRQGLKVQYVIFDEWAQIIEALKAGRIDVIPNIDMGEENGLTFTRPVEVARLHIFVRETTKDIHGINDLKGRKVAVVISNKGIDLINNYGESYPVIFNSTDEALLSLLGFDPLFERVLQISV
ncbi:MAG: transporter substrate-binding domain-containing protein [Syntrophales bacterium LBB04]|nr:transporter substrate-binding domain-containing protein [Syntrophales bacterium LBB04]